MKIQDIKVGYRIRKDIGDIKSLARSIQEIGLLHPIVVNEKNQLIAGARRLDACRSLGIEDIPVNVVNLEDLLKGEFHENAIRKDFTVTETVEIKRALEPEIKEEAEERQKSTQFGGEESAPPSDRIQRGKTREIVAGFVGVSHDTLSKMEDIVDAAETNPEQFADLPEKIDNGVISINYAAKMVRNAQAHEEKNIPKLPEGKFDIILADPPWSYDINTRGSPDEHYLVMEDTEIKALEIPSADDAILFLWATFPKLPEAISVLKAWGFKYKTGAVWVKDKIGTGYYFRGQAELLLVGEKGEMPVPQESDRYSSVIEAPRSEHSKKPNKIYEIIETMYPNRKYLELFARAKRDGWIVWGNEITASNCHRIGTVL